MWHSVMRGTECFNPGRRLSAYGAFHSFASGGRVVQPTTPMSSPGTGKSDKAQQSRGLATAVRESLAPGLLLVDPEGQSATLSPEAAGILGRPGVSECPASELPGTLMAVAREVSAGGAKSATRDLQLNLPVRGLVDLRVTAAPMQNGRGVAVALADLSVALHCEQRLERMDRLASLGTLAASTAHEIRNALVAGKTFMDLLLEQNPQAELSKVVRRELGRIDAIVARLLKFAGPEPVTVAPVRLHEVLDYSLRLLQPQFEVKAIAAERDFHAACDLVTGNESSLQQVFVNLLLNSAEAMGQEGKVTVTTQAVSSINGSGHAIASSNGPHLRVVIQDSGTGISAEHMPHLFEPFFTTKSDGTGLGLAISQRIIQEHRGTIDVESQPGSGARFIVTFPALG
jgi:two-component system sensor histidine kinase AtoS